MSHRPLEIPKGHGEVVCIPEFGRWLEWAETTAERLQNVSLFGFPLAALQSQARQELVACSRELLERWNLPTPPVNSGPWVATGHQPILFHSGIWVKTWSVDACCDQGATGLNVVVDSDVCERFVARIPRRNGSLKVMERALYTCGPGVPLEAAPPPQEVVWREFCAQLEQDLATVEVPALRERLARVEKAGLDSLRSARHLGEFGAALRRRLELSYRPVRYLEVTVSQLAGTGAFRRFAGWIIQHAEHFWECHNRALHQYRQEEGVRSAAQPFPDLRRAGDLVELPFWLVQDGRRRPVWVRASAGDPVLVCDGKAVGTAHDLPRELRPRALTLTLFLRLVVCDLFVHGLGGARYDRVTDRVMLEFFGTPPPPFAVLTATFHLPLARYADPQAAYAAAHQRWLDLQHNPDRYLPREGPIAALVEEKWRCIEALNAPDLPRRSRRELTRRIRVINESLRTYLQDRIHAVEAELQALRRAVEEHQVATDRGFAFFLFDPEEVREAVVRTEGARCGR